MNEKYTNDVNKILNSKAFARYIDKTQVAYLVQNDHISQRSLHVQLVSRLSRELGRGLNLDIDLIEAIALGHDVGHPPFGHEGEGYLSELSLEFGELSFAHPYQSCRLFELIEPLNLSLEVRDGFLCHDGGMQSRFYRPSTNKSELDHLNELILKKNDPNVNIWPMTIEGCLVKLCDTVSYLVRDLEDAHTLKLISFDQIPMTCLGKGWQEMLFFFKKDLLSNSLNQKGILISEECFEALMLIRKFNFEAIYLNPRLKVESERIKRAYRTVFMHLLEDLRSLRENSHIWKEFLEGKSSIYLLETSDIQKVIDYLAGMTDRYFLSFFQSIVTPSPIKL